MQLPSLPPPPPPDLAAVRAQLYFVIVVSSAMLVIAALWTYWARRTIRTAATRNLVAEQPSSPDVMGVELSQLSVDAPQTASPRYTVEAVPLPESDRERLLAGTLPVVAIATAVEPITRARCGR